MRGLVTFALGGALSLASALSEAGVPSLVAARLAMLTISTEGPGYRIYTVLPRYLRLRQKHDNPNFGQAADWLRQSAYGFILDELEAEGFPRNQMPAAMAAEYHALLEDSALIWIASSKQPGRPIGVISVSYDIGRGTAGERRLQGRAAGFAGFPRSKPRIGFVDVDYRSSEGRMVVHPFSSLYLSSRAWAVGGRSAVAEVKTLQIASDLSLPAKEFGVNEDTVRSHLVGLLQHFLSTDLLFYGPESAPASMASVLTPDRVFEKRMMETLVPRIQEVIHPQDEVILEHVIENCGHMACENPPPQPQILIDEVWAYTGALDPMSGKDRGEARAKLFNLGFGFDLPSADFPDPDVPEMRLRVQRLDRRRFDSGQILVPRGKRALIVPNGFPSSVPADHGLFTEPLCSGIILGHAGGAKISYEYDVGYRPGTARTMEAEVFDYFRGDEVMYLLREWNW